jgi:hypothetical protein
MRNLPKTELDPEIQQGIALRKQGPDADLIGHVDMALQASSREDMVTGRCFGLQISARELSSRVDAISLEHIRAIQVSTSSVMPCHMEEGEIPCRAEPGDWILTPNWDFGSVGASTSDRLVIRQADPQYAFVDRKVCLRSHRDSRPAQRVKECKCDLWFDANYLMVLAAISGSKQRSETIARLCICSVLLSSFATIVE